MEDIEVVKKITDGNLIGVGTRGRPWIGIGTKW
jgi:hypothetical protein